MNKKKIIDYVMNTPYNTNRAVLESMLDEDGGVQPTSDFIYLFSLKNRIDGIYSVLQPADEIESDTKYQIFWKIEHDSETYTPILAITGGFDMNEGRQLVPEELEPIGNFLKNLFDVYTWEYISNYLTFYS